MPERIIIVYCTEGDFRERAPESDVDRLIQLANAHENETGHDVFRWTSEDPDSELTIQMEELRKRRKN